MKNCKLAVVNSDNPIQNRTIPRPTKTGTRRRLSAVESTHLDNKEVLETRPKKTKRTSLEVSKSIPVSSLMAHQRLLGATKSLGICGKVGFNTSEEVSFTKYSDGSIRTKGVLLCKKAYCVKCSSYRARLAFERLNPVVKSVPTRVFITLTTGKIHNLKKLNEGQGKALQLTIKAVKRYFKKQFNQTISIVWSKEATFDLDNEKGLHYHLHRHLLALCEDSNFDYELFESIFREIWKDRAEKQGLIASQQAQKFIKVSTDKEEGLNHYLVKGLSHELSGGARKSSTKGQSLFTLLAESAEGSTKATKLYVNYLKSVKHNKTIQTDGPFLELEKKVLESEQRQIEEEVKEERQLQFGAYLYERFYKSRPELVEDLTRHALLDADLKTFEAFKDLVSAETQNRIIEDLEEDSYDFSLHTSIEKMKNGEITKQESLIEMSRKEALRIQEDFDYTLLGLLEEYLHKFEIDTRTLNRRKLHYSRALTIIS